MQTNRVVTLNDALQHAHNELKRMKDAYPKLARKGKRMKKRAERHLAIQQLTIESLEDHIRHIDASSIGTYSKGLNWRRIFGVVAIEIIDQMFVQDGSSDDEDATDGADQGSFKINLGDVMKFASAFTSQQQPEAQSPEQPVE